MRRFTSFLLFIFFLPIYVVAQEPALVLPLGHTEPINFVNFSADGNKIVTTSSDNTLKIWETASGRLLKDYQLGISTATCFNWQKMIVANIDTVRVRDGNTGKEISRFLGGSKRRISSIILSANGSKLLAISATNKNNAVLVQSIEVWDISSKPVLVDSLINSNVVDGVVFNVFVSNDFTKFAFADKQQIIIKNFDTNKKIAAFKTPLNLGASSIVFSPSGELIYTLRDSVVKSWDVLTGMQTNFKLSLQNQVSTLLLNSHGDRIITLEEKNNIKIWDTLGNKLAFIPDQKQILSASGNDYLITESVSGEKRIWNFMDGKYVSQPMDGKPREKNKQSLVAINNDNELFIAVNKNEATIYETQNGRQYAELKGHNLKILAHRVWTNGEKISIFYEDNTCRIWDIKKGKLEISFKADIPPKQAIISPDGAKLAVLSTDTTKVWDIASGKILAVINKNIDIFIFPNYQGIVLFHDVKKATDRVTIWNVDSNIEVITVNHNPGIFCTDGSIIASSVKNSIDNNQLNIWITESGAKIRTIDSANTILFSGDGAMFATTSAQIDNKIKIDSLNKITDTSGQSTFVIKTNLDCLLKPIAFSKGARKIAFYSPNCNAPIQVWDVVNRKQLCSLNGKYSSIKFSQDGAKIAAVKNDQSVILFDAVTGDTINTLKGYTGNVFGVLNIDMNQSKLKKEADFLSFLPNGNIVTRMYDNTINFWDDNGQFLYRFFAVDSMDYLAVDADGRYDGTTGARDQLYYVCGDEIIQLEQIKKVSWEVGLVEKITDKSAPGSFLTKKLSEISICGNTPIINLVKQTDSSAIYKIIRRSGGLGELTVFVNEKGVENIDTTSLKFIKNEALVEINTEKYANYFDNGTDNTVYLRAKTSNKIMSSRGGEITQRGKSGTNKETKLYAIIIGIDQYSGANLNLQFCVKDANAFEEVLGKSSKEFLNVNQKDDNVVIYKLISGAQNTAPNKKNIKETFEKIAKVAKPNDIVLIFIAGHGTIYPEGSDNFYCLTAEANSFAEVENIEKRKTMSINGEELISWFKKIYAKRQIMILDVCHSGAIVGNIDRVKSEFNNGNPRQEMAIDNLNKESGVYVLSGATAGTLANEITPLNQGMLTFSILYGMKNGSALRNNHFLDIKELIYGSIANLKTFSRYFGVTQDPYLGFPSGGDSYNIGIVDKKIQSEIKLESRKPIMVRCAITNKDAFNEFDDNDNVVNNKLDSILTALNKKDIFSFTYLPDFKADSLPIYKIKGEYELENNMMKINYKLLVSNGKPIVFDQIISPAADPERIVAKMIKQIDLHMEKMFKNPNNR